MKRYYKNLAVALILMLTLSLCPMTAFAAEEDGDEPIVDSVMLSESTLSDEDTDLGLTDDILTANESKLVAAADGIQINPGSTIVATNINSEEAEAYYTPTASSSYDNYKYNVNVPKAGTLMITYYSNNSSSIKVNGSWADLSYSSEEDGITIKRAFYYLGKAGNADMTIDMLSSGNIVVFSVQYAPQSATLTASKSGTTYILGRSSTSSKVSTFKVKTPYKGYMDTKIIDASGYEYPSSIYYKTSGFKDYEYLSTSDFERYIGVKKGTYKISVKGSTPIYAVSVKTKKVKEGKFGTSKKKAASLKRKSARKGLIISNSKKVHWYKFRNPKSKKVMLAVANKISSGGYGGLKVTVYNSSGSSTSERIYHDTGTMKMQLYTSGNNYKLAKGTYWIKIESYDKGNGYFTVKWS